MSREELIEDIKDGKTLICLDRPEFDYLGVLCDLLPESPLTNFEISFCDNDYPTEYFCDVLAQAKHLTSLQISESDGVLLDELAENIGNLSLTNLEIICCDATRFVTSPTLTSLAMNSNLIRMDDMDKIELGNLTTLELFSNEIGSHGAKLIAESLPSSRLTNLDLSYNHIGEDGIASLTEALQFSTLEILELQGNNIGDKSIQRIAEILPSTKLIKLNLAANLITEDGAQHLASTLPQCNVEILLVDGNLLHCKGLEYILDILPMSKLVKLDISRNKIGNIGAVKLAEAIPQCKLVKLKYNLNGIGDKYKKLILDSMDRNFTIKSDKKLPPDERLELFLSKRQMKSARNYKNQLS